MRSIRLPTASGSGPETVPDANRSPGEVPAPLTVMCASCWAGVQYMSANPTSLISVGPAPAARAAAVSSHTSKWRSKPHGLLGAQMVGDRGLLKRWRDPMWGECLERHEPRGHRGREALAEERAERLVLERLDVARRPVVHEAHAVEVVAGVVDVDRGPRLAADADHGADLEFDVETLRGADQRFAVDQAMPDGSADIGAVGHERAAAAVVADRDVPPVGHQRFAVGAEQSTEVRGVVDGRVEVHVVDGSNRDAHHHVASGPHVSRQARRCRRVVGQLEQARTRRRPDDGPGREIPIEVRAGEAAVGEADAVEDAGCDRRGEIERRVADRDPCS